MRRLLVSLFVVVGFALGIWTGRSSIQKSTDEEMYARVMLQYADLISVRKSLRDMGQSKTIAALDMKISLVFGELEQCETLRIPSAAGFAIRQRLSQTYAKELTLLPTEANSDQR